MKRILLFTVIGLLLGGCSKKDGYPFTYITTEEPAMVVVDREESYTSYFRYTHPIQLRDITAANSFDEEPQMLTYFVIYDWQEDHDLPWEMETKGVLVVQDWTQGIWVTISPDAPYSIYHINVKPQSRDPQTIVPNQICIIRK